MSIVEVESYAIFSKNINFLWNARKLLMKSNLTKKQRKTNIQFLKFLKNSDLLWYSLTAFY